MPSATEILQALLSKPDVPYFTESAMELVENGADPMVRLEQFPYWTLLHLLAYKNKDGINNDAMAQLIEKHPKVLTETGLFLHPLQILIESFRSGKVAFEDLKQTGLFLAEHGANVGVMGIPSGLTLLHILASENDENEEAILKLIQMNPGLLLIRNFDDQTAFEYIASRHDLEKTKALLSKKQAELLCVVDSIEAMASYGETLTQEEGSSKGKEVSQLAADLKAIFSDFLYKPKKYTLEEFKENFLDKLHSKDKEMSAYRVNWETIVKNILIALTGIGVFCIAGQLVYSQMTKGRPLFFFQEDKTSSEKKIESIELAITQNTMW